MKKFILSILAIMFLFSTGFAAEPIKTAGSLNGHFWNSLAENQKVAFLTGFNDGLLTGTAGIAAVMKKNYDDVRETKMPVNSFLEQFQLEATYNDIKDYLNNFYKTPQNRLLPIKDVFQYFASLSKGQVTKEAIDKKSAYDINWYFQNQNNE